MHYAAQWLMFASAVTALAGGCGVDFLEPVPSGGPSIAVLRPESGFVGDRLVIEGSGFASVATGNQVFIGAASAEVLSVDVAGSRLEVRIPLEAPDGAARVTLSTPEGSAEALEAFGVLGRGHPRDQRIVGTVDLRPGVEACALDGAGDRLLVLSPTLAALVGVDLTTLQLADAFPVTRKETGPADVLDIAVSDGSDPLVFELHASNPADPRRGLVMSRRIEDAPLLANTSPIGRNPARLVGAPRGTDIVAAAASGGALHLLERDDPGEAAVSSRAVQVGTDIVDMAWSRFARRLVGVGSGGDLLVLETASGDLQRIRVGEASEGANAIGLSQDGRFAALVFGAVDQVRVVDLDDPSAAPLEVTVPVKPTAARFAPDASALFVATSGDGRIKRVELTGERVGAITGAVSVGTDIVCLEQAIGSERLVAVSAQENRVSLVETGLFSVIGEVELRSLPQDVVLVEEGAQPLVTFDLNFSAVVLSREGSLRGVVDAFPLGRPSLLAHDEAADLLVMASRKDQRLLYLHEAGTGVNGWSEIQSVSAARPLPGTPIEMALGEGVLLRVLADDGAPSLVAFDTSTEPQGREVEGLDAAPLAIAETPAGPPVALLADGTFTEVLPESASLGRLIMNMNIAACRAGLTGCARQIVVDREGARAFVSTGPVGGLADRIAVMDLQLQEQQTEVEVVAANGRLALSPDGRRLYITGGPSDGPGVVSILDTETLEIDLTLSVPDGPASLTFSPDGAQAYLLHPDADRLTLIE